MATLVRPPAKSLDDAELARLAVAGDGAAFAELYDRHEQRVYGFCMRMLCNPHDAADATQETFVRLLARLPALEGRELNFIAYVLTSARHACYDMIESRKRTEPVADQPEPPTSQPGALDEDPERAALLSDQRETVMAANASLPERQREVLALREVELLSYEEIGEIMDLRANAVAQLISRARIKLRDALRGSALASIEATSPDCTRALPLLATLHDEQREDPDAINWLRSHLAACGTCRARRAAMEEAGVSYRMLLPLVPLVWLRQAAIARAAEFVGADWSHIGAREIESDEQSPEPHTDSESQPPGASGAGSEGSLRRRRLVEIALAVVVTVGALLALTATVSPDRVQPAVTAIPVNAPIAVPPHHVALRRAVHRAHARAHGSTIVAATQLSSTSTSTVASSSTVGGAAFTGPAAGVGPSGGSPQASHPTVVPHRGGGSNSSSGIGPGPAPSTGTPSTSGSSSTTTTTPTATATTTTPTATATTTTTVASTTSTSSNPAGTGSSGSGSTGSGPGSGCTITPNGCSPPGTPPGSGPPR
jgi:RNA polymerase sigma factor (sigma-70 family)